MNLYQYILIVLVFTIAPLYVSAGNPGYELFFKEEEPGIDPYLTRMSVTDKYLRIDDLSESEQSGYMLFDVDAQIIYSVGHANQSVLVIKPYTFEVPKISDKLIVEDVLLKDAPKISGKAVRSYRVELRDKHMSELCTSVQYVPGLLPEIGKVLQHWQRVVSGNQVKTLDHTPLEFQTPCMLSDQVYNTGDYYAKGLVIQEWHSNNKSRLLQDYSRKTFDERFFTVPEDYRQFSLDD